MNICNDFPSVNILYGQEPVSLKTCIVFKRRILHLFNKLDKKNVVMKPFFIQNVNLNHNVLHTNITCHATFSCKEK